MGELLEDFGEVEPHSGVDLLDICGRVLVCKLYGYREIRLCVCLKSSSEA